MNAIGWIILVAIVIGGIWIWDSNRSERITNCAVRQQDVYLEVHYYSKGLSPTPQDILEAYKAAEADCG